MERTGRKRRPVIGVTTRHGSDAWVTKNTFRYLHVLEQHGAAVVVLSPDTPVVLPDGDRRVPDKEGILPIDVLEALDGVVLSGGGDVHPSWFGQTLNGAETDRIDLMRDALELSLTRAALQQDIPVFGICRGCQVLNVAAGGGLLQHFEGHRSPKGQTAYHHVIVRQGTKLGAITSATTLKVNTFHHQGVDTANLAPPFAVSGTAVPDAWLVEAFESPDHRWVLGVQWHPERVFELDATHRLIWQSFVSACDHR